MTSSALLDFLNTAQPAALTTLPGVGPALAERICAARPFNSLDDCCRVRGITLSFIHRLEAAMPEPEPESPLEITPVQTEEKPVVVEEPPVPAPPPHPSGKPPRKPASESGIGRFLKGLVIFLLRLIMVLIILTIFAVAIAYVTPLVYERYVMPVEMNAAQVATLRTQQAQSAQQIADLQARLATAESGQAQQAENLRGLDSRVQSIETSIADHTKKLATLDEMQEELLKANEASMARMNNQLELLKAMEMLARARLFLYQSNFGLARQDAQSAHEILIGLQQASPEAATPELKEALFRLELVLKNLPNFPVAASDDLDLAWTVLAEGLPNQASLPDESATPTPMPTEAPTPTPTATP